MKHIRNISVGAPQKANAFQDVLCIVLQTVHALLGFLGGSSPILEFANDKCTIPQPNQD